LLGIGCTTLPPSGLATEILVSNPALKVTITTEELRTEAELAIVSAGAVEGVPERLRAELSSLLNDSYRRKALSAVAISQGLETDPLVATELRVARERALARAALRSRRDALQEDMPDFSKRAAEVYHASPEQYRTEETVEVAHILLTSSEPSATAARRDEMEKIRRRLLDGEEFAGLAREFSEDSASASSGGRLRRFVRGKMVAEFEDAAFGLREPGEISAIVETQFGLHLIQLLNREEARQLSFEEIKPALVSRLSKEWLDNRLEEWRRAIVDPDKAVINRDAIEKALAEISRQLSQ